MNKKNIFAAGILAISIVTQVNAEPFKGFYAGVKAGWSQLDADAKVSGTYNGQTPVVYKGGTRNDFIGGLQLGYSGLLSDLYLAGEINLDFLSKSGIRKNLILPGADFKFGYRSGRIVAYANVGVVVDKFKLTTSLGNKQKTMAGFRPGAGILASLGDFQISTEYNYTQFDSLSIKATGALAKIRPNYHTIAVRLSYCF